MFLFLTIGKGLADIIGQFDHISCVFSCFIWFGFKLCSIEKLALMRTTGELTEQGHEVKEARWTPETILEYSICLTLYSCVLVLHLIQYVPAYYNFFLSI